MCVWPAWLVSSLGSFSAQADLSEAYGAACEDLLDWLGALELKLLDAADRGAGLATNGSHQNAIHFDS